MTHITPRASELLDYLQSKGDVAAREALLDLDMVSGSLTRRITELKDAGYPIDGEVRHHPTTGRRYKRYSLAV